MPFEHTPPSPVPRTGALGAAAATAVAAGWVLTATRLHIRTRQLHHAQHDPVTGLLTRAAWEPVAQTAVRHHGRVGVLDVDEFKSLNDTYGHHIGDHVLRVIATRLTTYLGRTAVIGRYGGDEIAFVVRPTGLGRTESLRSTLTKPIALSPTEYLRVGVSLGISTRHYASLSDALHTADLAMYAAKTHHATPRAHPVRTPRPRRGDAHAHTQVRFGGEQR